MRASVWRFRSPAEAHRRFPSCAIFGARRGALYFAMERANLVVALSRAEVANLATQHSTELDALTTGRTAKVLRGSTGGVR